MNLVSILQCGLFGSMFVLASISTNSNINAFTAVPKTIHNLSPQTLKTAFSLNKIRLKNQKMNYYDRIPSFEECKRICSEYYYFSHSSQEVHDEIIHSFKYTIGPVRKIWEGKEDDGRVNIRGITYDNSGNLLALPFPKFFNNGEIQQTKNLDINEAVHIVEKLDGSLISFFKINDILEIKTMKSFHSEVANDARRFLKTEECTRVREFSSCLVDIGLSPIFEYVSPLNQIVVDYKKENFVFLGARSMKTGKIYMPSEFNTMHITVPCVFSSEMVSTYLEEKNIEGVVLTMPDGLLFKMKSDEYVQVHKGSNAVFSGNKTKILNLITIGKIDDVKGILSKKNATQRLELIDIVEDKYTQRYVELERQAQSFVDENMRIGRKEIGIQLGNNSSVFGEDTRVIKMLVFKMIDRRDYKDILNNHILLESMEW